MSDVDENVGGSVSARVRPDEPDPAAPPAPASRPPAEARLVAPPAPPAARRTPKWDRRPPRDWRWWVGGLGKTLIAVGLLMLAFVGYQLWGTGIETARAQRSLERDFDELLATAPPVDPARTVPSPALTDDVAPPPAADPEAAADPESGADPVVGVDAAPAAPIEVLPVEAQNIPEVEDGSAIARIEIPAIGVDDIVVAGVATRDLKKGPGHFPGTPLPGQLGNAAIAGHRTTYGQPFHDVDKLRPGDEIVVTTLTGRYVYRVTGQQIVPPSAGHVVATTDPSQATLTLTSCHPKWTARERIVIASALDADASSVVGEPVLNYGRPMVEDDADATAAGQAADEADDADDADDAAVDATVAPESDGSAGGPTGTLAESVTIGVEALGSAAANEGIADAFADGWFSDPAANPHVLFWGALLALIGAGAYLLSRRVRRDWVGALVGIVPFVVTLYFFFQNVNRLLPPNL